MSIEAMKQALEALKHAAKCVQNNSCPAEMGHDWDGQIESLRQAIADFEKQEPNGYLWFTHHMEQRFTHYKPRQEQMIGEPTPVYTHPQPKREWVGLTDEEFDQMLTNAGFTRTDLMMIGACVDDIRQMIETKLRSKNT